MKRRRLQAAPRLALLLALCLGAASAAAGDPFFSAWRTYGPEDGLPAKKTFAVLADGPRVWAGTERGLALLQDGAVRVWGVEQGLPFPAVTALAVSPATGDLWIGTMGGVARLSGDRLTVFNQLNSGLANDVIYGIAADGADVWIATAAGLSRYSTADGEWQIFDTSNTLMHEPWTYAVAAREGTVYVAVWGSGVVVREAGTGHFRVHRDPDGEMEIDLFRDDGLVHDVTSAISVSGEVMWVGTYFGLSRYDGRRWQSYSAADSGLAGDFINFVKAGGDSVWIGTDQGLSRFDSRTWHTWSLEPESGRFGLVVDQGAGRERRPTTATGFASNTIFGIDLQGRDVWLATAEGLSHGIAAASGGRSAGGGER